MQRIRNSACGRLGGSLRLLDRIVLDHHAIVLDIRERLLVAKHPDATLRQLRDRLGVGGSIMLIWRALAFDTDALQNPVLTRSFGIIRHRGEHFFHRIFQSHPHRARNDGMTDVELG